MCQFSKQIIAGCARVEFGFQRGQLLLSQLASLGIGQQPIEAASDVSYMKCNRRQPGGPRIQLLVGEMPAPAFQIFFGQFERMQNGTLNRRNLRQRAA